MDFKSTNLPEETQFPKLIRDRIPEIIKNKGQHANIQKITSDDEFLGYLLKKMIEESYELQHSVNIGNMQEELADIFEIIYAILKLKGWTIEDIIKVQKEKRNKNGGFDGRQLLLKLSK